MACLVHRAPPVEQKFVDLRRDSLPDKKASREKFQALLHRAKVSDASSGRGAEAKGLTIFDAARTPQAEMVLVFQDATVLLRPEVIAGIARGFQETARQLQERELRGLWVSRHARVLLVEDPPANKATPLPGTCLWWGLEVRSTTTQTEITGYLM